MILTHQQLAAMSGYDVNQKSRIREWAKKSRHLRLMPPGRDDTVSAIVVTDVKKESKKPNFAGLT